MPGWPNLVEAADLKSASWGFESPSRYHTTNKHMRHKRIGWAIGPGMIVGIVLAVGLMHAYHTYMEIGERNHSPISVELFVDHMRCISCSS